MSVTRQEKPGRPRLLVVTGIHRSGTTFLGRLLQRHPRVTYLHEPFNYDRGCVGVPARYPWVRADDSAETRHVRKLVDDVLDLRCRYKRRITPTPASPEPLPRAVARLVTGGRGGADLLRARWRRALSSVTRGTGNGQPSTPLAPPAVLVKDPFVLQLVDLLVDEFDARVVVMARHPVPVWRSTQRLGWSFEFAGFGGSPFWAQTARNQADLDALTPIERLGALWRMLYEQALASQARRPDRVLIVRHERLCEDAPGTVSRVLQHLRLSPSRAVDQALETLTGGDVVTPTSARLHVLRRDTVRLGRSWQDDVRDDEERLLRPMVEGLVTELHGSWRETPQASREGRTREGRTT